MGDLIDRAEALRWTKPEEWGTPDERWRPESEYGRMLKALPSAERIGRWVQWVNDNGIWSCSLCQSWIPDEQHYYARYCLHCGAKMEE